MNYKRKVFRDVFILFTALSAILAIVAYILLRGEPIEVIQWGELAKGLILFAALSVILAVVAYIDPGSRFIPDEEPSFLYKGDHTNE